MSSPNDSSLDELDTVNIKEFLDQDSRPTFILDLDPDDLKAKFTKNTISPIFCNDALRSHHKLLDTLLGEAENADAVDLAHQAGSDFRSWAISVTKFDDSKDIFPLTYFYQGLLWTGSTVKRRWRIISGNQCYQVPDIPKRNLSAGPPGEVATGGYAVEQAVLKEINGIVSPNRIGIHGAGMQSLVSYNPVVRNDRSKDMESTTLYSDRVYTSASKPERFSSRSSNGTGNTKTSMSITLATPEKGVPDWTALHPKGVLSEFMIFARSIDWAATALGAMSTWSRELRQAANLVMANPHPAALFWGNELTVLYNEPYKNEVAGNKHPSLMGTGFGGPFHEIWDSLNALFTECARTGKSIRRENDQLFIERFGYLEETFFSWSFTPLYGGTSRILGFYNAPFETTANCISHRRIQTIQKLGQTGTFARTVKDFWRCILDGLADNHFDVPFALLYSVMDSDDGDASSISSGSTIALKSCVYEGSIAVPDGHPAAPRKLDLRRSREGFIPSFREAMRTREPTKLQTRDGTLPEALLEGINWRGYGDPCKEAVIFPIRPTNGELVLAFLLLGVNPRRAYDEEYKAFTVLMNRQLATGLASVMLFEDEIRRSKNAVEAATLQQEQLNVQLAAQTNRLRRMTALSPLGMFYINPDGLILEANDRYFEMTSQDRDTMTEMSWMDQLVPESKDIMAEGWHRLSVDRLPWSAELRLNKQWIDSSNSEAEPIDYWVLANSQPEITPEGELRCIMGSITDISHLKWAQGLQDRRLREAEETRRQQNEFIDITSHEMRNPLSAILQCADDIASTLTQYQTQQQAAGVGVISPSVEECIESANTIALCASHQKGIIDDILTVSKLDSNLLVLTPVVVQPLHVARRIAKIFDSELLAKRIEFNFVASPSIQKCNADWVSMDPSRMSQVVINLMTNAIKFTSERANRKIIMAIGASTTPPIPTRTPDFDYIPRKNGTISTALGDDWKSGEAVYIRLKVQDTGCGLTENEKQSLFQRFQQASPRTHAQYGGSGLGLFISRQLTELHGGQIGVASKAGVGSTFGFFIRTRRASPPPDQIVSNVRPVRPDRPASAPVTTQLSTRLSQPTNLRSSIAPISQTLSDEPPSLSVLVVEDNLVNQKVLTKQLRKAGCKVDVADNGQIALDFLETTEFRKDDGQKLSVVLMDLEMPVMDGLTCVKNIRRMEAEGLIKGHVPVIAVTANVRHEQVAVAKESGMDDVVSKPFRIPDLLEKVKELLGEADVDSF